MAPNPEILDTVVTVVAIEVAGRDYKELLRAWLGNPDELAPMAPTIVQRYHNAAAQRRARAEGRLPPLLPAPREDPPAEFEAPDRHERRRGLFASRRDRLAR